ncbi:hypothetical protein FS749_016229 [Ceratobasidium sp. UAMH 11750]|nr:hypothetical protein FS749_016229 [Ceratobasidium sp. UAMH 11750]
MAVVSSAVPMLGRRIHVKKLGLEGEATDESYWLWLDFPESIKGLRSKCMEAFEPPRDYSIRFIHDDELLCGNGLETLPNKSELWVQFVPKSAPLTPVSARKSRKKRPILAEDDENVDPCPNANIDTGSPIRKRQRLQLRLGVSNLDLSTSTPPSPSPAESLKPSRADSPLVTTLSPRCTSPLLPLKPIALDAVPRNRRHRSNASASFFEPTGAPGELTTRAPTPPISSDEHAGDVPAIAWEMENRDESYYGYGILSFDKPRHEWVPSIAFDLLPRYSAGVPAGIDFNLLVCDVPYDVTVGEIRSALVANFALDPRRLPKVEFHLVRKGERLEDWMTCVPAYLADGDAVFIEFGDGFAAQSNPADDEDYDDSEDPLVQEDLEEIKLVKLPCDSDEE